MECYRPNRDIILGVMWPLAFVLLCKCAGDSPVSGNHHARLVDPLVRLTVADKVWGEASGQEVNLLLTYVSNVFLRMTKRQGFVAIVDHSSYPFPFTSWPPSPDHVAKIHLLVKGRYWCQFVYQYSHEMCHALAMTTNGDPNKSANEWFEESLADAASILVMKATAKSWAVTPPFSGQESYASAVAEYAQSEQDQLKVDTTTRSKFKSWFAKNKAEMKNHPTDRERDHVVASVLWRILDAKPSYWPAISYLNTAKVGNDANFSTYLSGWRDSCPHAYKGFVDEVASWWGLQLDGAKVTRRVQPLKRIANGHDLRAISV
jgi:hypothetical protein